MSQVTFTAAIIAFLQLIAPTPLDAQVKSDNRKPSTIKVVIEQGHGYRIETYELRMDRLEPITSRQLDVRTAMLLDPIIRKLTAKLVPPPFTEDNGERNRPVEEQPITKVVIQEETPNRRREILFATEYARQLGLEEELMFILALASMR